jgi:adenine phosphoribosyltransferase
MDKFYNIKIAGLERKLPVCKVSAELSIAAFVLFGDVEMTVAAAAHLLKAAPPHDIIITAEAKGIPLVHEMARQSGENSYIIARKVVKVYMKEVFSVELQSITTQKKQNLYIDTDEAARMKDKRVLIVDDVISTGESLRAVEKLVKESGGVIAGKMAVLAEGDAKYRDDIIYLEHLPLLNPDGTPKA